MTASSGLKVLSFIKLNKLWRYSTSHTSICLITGIRQSLQQYKKARVDEKQNPLETEQAQITYLCSFQISLGPLGLQALGVGIGAQC